MLPPFTPSRSDDHRTQASSVHSLVPCIGKDVPDEDPFLLHEAIRFVIFEAEVDKKHGGGKIFSHIDLGSHFLGLGQGIANTSEYDTTTGAKQSDLAMNMNSGPGMLNTSDVVTKLRQLVIEDSVRFIKTQLLR